MQGIITYDALFGLLKKRNYRLVNVETAVLGSDVPYRDQNDVNNSPDAQTAKTEQFSDALSPLAEIKAIGAKTAQSDGQQQAGRPSIPSGPITRQHLVEGSSSQAEHVGANRAVAFEARLG